MSRPIHRSSSKTFAQRGASLMLHVCLLLSLWRAPVPLLHSHDSLDQRTAATRFWSEHLDRFHSRHEPLDASHPETETVEGQGWHLHLVLPWELADKHDDTQHPRGVPDSLRVESDQLHSTWTAIVKAESDHGRVIGTDPAMLAPSNILSPILSRPVGVQVLLSYSDRISWRALACVARC